MGLVHGSVSSHAVQLVAGGVAKVSLLERTVAECEPLQPPPACLYNWTSPEILLAVAGPAFAGGAIAQPSSKPPPPRACGFGS